MTQQHIKETIAKANAMLGKDDRTVKLRTNGASKASPIEAGTSKAGSNERCVDLRVYSSADFLAPIALERYLLPGLIPAEAYTLIAGALSSYKSTLLRYLALWRATGFDLLDLDPDGAGCDVGPVLLCFYEDSERRILNSPRRIIQHAHRRIGEQHGPRVAEQFVAKAAANLRSVPMTGKLGATIVHRAESGLILPNEVLIEELLTQARALASSGVMICIDPLRLAITGSQNDDDGADIVVHTLNRIALALPDSGVVVCSHTNKAEAREPTEGYAGAAYATSGSALYSQHARSNFLMARVRPDVAATLQTNLTPAELQRQPIARLTHGRLSHGAESSERFLLMDKGVLEPLARRPELDTAERIRDFGPVVADAIARLKQAGVRASAAAIQHDATIRAYAPEKKVRTYLTLLEQNGYIEFEGSTKNRMGKLTDKAIASLPRIAANRLREPHERS